MKEVQTIKYQSNDGKIFDTKIQCLEHDFCIRFIEIFQKTCDVYFLEETAKLAFLNLSFFAETYSEKKNLDAESEVRNEPN